MSVIDKLYTPLLESFGYKVSSTGMIEVPSPEGIPCPFTIDGKTLALPIRDVLKEADWDNVVPFHPLSENPQRKKSIVQEHLAKMASLRVLEVVRVLMVEIIAISSAHDIHESLTTEQRLALTKVPEANSKMVKAFMEIFSKHITNYDGVVNLYVKRGGQMAGEEYARLCAPRFPIMEDEFNAEKRIAGHKLPNVKTGEHFYALLRYLLPSIDVDEGYWFGVKGGQAPAFRVLMESYGLIMKDLMKVVKVFRKASEAINDLYVKMDWVKELQNIKDLAIEIPPLEPNIGEMDREELDKARSKPVSPRAAPTNQIRDERAGASPDDGQISPYARRQAAPVAGGRFNNQGGYNQSNRQGYQGQNYQGYQAPNQGGYQSRQSYQPRNRFEQDQRPQYAFTGNQNTGGSPYRPRRYGNQPDY